MDLGQEGRRGHAEANEAAQIKAAGKFVGSESAVILAIQRRAAVTLLNPGASRG